ncbi:hypothetical protein PQ459_10285 [Chryseobacterium sp. KACC 21268]|nr:hypothetical protein PQ459_10285 [Chryseobacterium sp. KACC 21268]
MAIQSGKFIDKDLSDYLREFTSNDDQIDLSTDTVSNYTIREVMMRRRKVTEENRPVFLKFIRRAIDNADSRIIKSTKCKKDLLELLDTI